MKITLATVELFDRGLRGLQGKVESLNKRAVRHKMAPVEISVLREKAFFPVYRGGIGRAESLYTVEINGCEPCIDGWRLGARIEFNAVGAIVRPAPGAPEGEFIRYAAVAPICEHCNTNRKRNDIFVLVGPNGEHKLVGRNCLADFLRDGDADSLARYAEFADIVRDIDPAGCEDEFERMGGGRSVPFMALDRYLPVVAMLSRRLGWMSRTAAKDCEGVSSTADHAGYYFYGHGKGHARWIEENELFACADDDELAGRAIEWAKTVDTSRSEYLDVIKKIACAGTVDMRTLSGYAASIIIAYRKACEREAEYAEKAKIAKNRVWFGTVGRREKGIKATCVGKHSHEGYYGVTTIIRFEVSVNEGEKAVLVWFASGDRFNEFEEGDEYAFDAMIKAHDDDARYGRDTKINRVTVK